MDDVPRPADSQYLLFRSIPRLMLISLQLLKTNVIKKIILDESV